jgi:hypothetical protein
VNWAAATADLASMDMCFTIEPPSIGCADPSGGDIVTYLISVFDASGEIIPNGTTTRSYSSTNLLVYLNDVTYSASGTVSVSVEIPDPNGGTYTGSPGTAGYNAMNLPVVLQDTVVVGPSGENLTFEVVTQGALGVGLFVTNSDDQHDEGVSAGYTLSTTEVETSDITVVIDSVSSPGTYIYSFTILPAYFRLGHFTFPFTICVSNSVGVGIQGAVNNPV